MDNQLTREEVFNRISAERDYQDSVWGTMDQTNTLGDYMLYMERYLTKAKSQYTGSDEFTDVTVDIRKVVALGVACLEKYGCPNRMLTQLRSEND